MGKFKNPSDFLRFCYCLNNGSLPPLKPAGKPVRKTVFLSPEEKAANPIESSFKYKAFAIFEQNEKEMKKSKLLCLGLLSLALACQNSPEESQESEQSEGPAAHENGHSEDHGSDALPAVPENARVFFANLNDGDTVMSPFYVSFGIEGMEVEPAGKVNPGKGHHHIIINGDYIASGGTVPADSVNIHYGGGQIGDTLRLPAGMHKLTMQFADGYHRSYGEQMSSSIQIMVQ